MLCVCVWEIAQDVVPFGCDVVPVEAILEFLDERSRPFFCGFDQSAVENRHRGAGPPPDLLAQYLPRELSATLNGLQHLPQVSA
jgi:hypothetical protein